MDVFKKKQKTFDEIIRDNYFYLEYDSNLISNEDVLALYKESLHIAVENNPILAPLLDEKQYIISQDSLGPKSGYRFIRMRQYIDHEEERRKYINHIKNALLNGFNV